LTINFGSGLTPHHGLTSVVWGAARTGKSKHSSPRLLTGRSVVRGKEVLKKQRTAGGRPGSESNFIHHECESVRRLHTTYPTDPPQPLRLRHVIAQRWRVILLLPPNEPACIHPATTLSCLSFTTSKCCLHRSHLNTFLEQFWHNPISLCLF